MAMDVLMEPDAFLCLQVAAMLGYRLKAHGYRSTARSAQPVVTGLKEEEEDPKDRWLLQKEDRGGSPQGAKGD